LTDEVNRIEVARPDSCDDKMRALKQYRRARGMCEGCGKMVLWPSVCSHITVTCYTRTLGALF
jgi:hypothetical protein